MEVLELHLKNCPLFSILFLWNAGGTEVRKEPVMFLTQLGAGTTGSGTAPTSAGKIAPRKMTTFWSEPGSNSRRRSLQAMG